MKLGVAISAVLLASQCGALSCCRDASCGGREPRRDDDPALSLSPADQRRACEAAGQQLSKLGCKQARPDFADVCANALEAGVPIRPACLASIEDCAEVDGRCRTGADAGAGDAS